MAEDVLHGERVALRPLAEDDIPRLAEILAHPEIAQWWQGHDEARIRRELIEDPQVTACVVELEDCVIGLIEYSEENDPDYRHASIDVTLDAEHLGQGLGSDAVRTLARYLFEIRGHHRVTMDPAVTNDRAIAAYTKVGFKPVGVMRQYERVSEGVWRDNLLMDLLRDEFEV